MAEHRIQEPCACDWVDKGLIQTFQDERDGFIEPTIWTPFMH